MRVNFFAPMRLTLAVLPADAGCGDGLIVNVASMGGRLGIIHEAAYCASKFALCGWSESMAVDLHDTGVSVKLIELGPVDTEIWDQPDNEDPLYDGPKVPADEVAEGILAALGQRRFRALPAGHEGRSSTPKTPTSTPTSPVPPRWRGDEARWFTGCHPSRSRCQSDATALAQNLAHTPTALLDVPEPSFLHDDWVITRPRLTGRLRVGFQADPARLRRG